MKEELKDVSRNIEVIVDSDNKSETAQLEQTK